ncbi:MAG: hypothetical protein GY822_05545 [Deltaproteobacteria bacterium]|nr:hypothetical protein [Deltaproteobacteria bacterium]
MGQLALRTLMKILSEQGCDFLEGHIHLRNTPS